MSTHPPWTARPPHLQRWTDPASGLDKVYLRQPGCPKHRLSAPWGSQALADEVARITAKEKPRKRLAPLTGTVAGAILDYRGSKAGVLPHKDASADFLALAPRTQIDYERILDEFDETFDGVLLEDINAAFILDLRDAWAKRGFRAANLRLQLLKNILRRPLIVGAIAGDPFARIEKLARPSTMGQANPAWEDVEVAVAIEAALAAKRPGLARAIALGRWGGFRKQTICSVPLRARIERQGADGAPERRIQWLTEKRKVVCDRREDPRLTALLASTPNNALTIAYNGQGNPWTPRALSHRLDDLLDKLVKAKKVRANLTAHGLRHARGVELALAGASDAEIMVQLDHASPRQAMLYRAQADRRRLSDSGQDRVDAEIIKLAKAREARVAENGG